MISKIEYRYTFIALGILAIIVNKIFAYTPQFVEQVYFSGIFQLLRVIYDYTLGWLPFPIIYLAFPLSIFWLGRIFSKSLDKTHNKPWYMKVANVLLDMSSFVFFVIFLFYVVWGFNYQRPSIYEQLDMPVSKVDSSYLLQEAERVTQKMIALRNEVSQDTAVLSIDNLPEDLEFQIREEQKRLLSSWDMAHYGKVRIRVLKPKGILLRLSSAGVYAPFVFEGHIDAGLHPIQWPFTMAHEMAHGYGYGDEGACNFIGYLTCMQSDIPILKYSATRAYWRYLMNDLRKVNPKVYNQIRKNLPQAVLNDLNAIYNNVMKYPDLFPAARDVIYDQYLKSNGISSGLQNYGHMVKYVKAYNER